MTDLEGVQPNTETVNGYVISYSHAALISGTALETVVVSITPGITGQVDVVIGIGRNYFEAKADAFARAKRMIAGNPRNY